MREAILRAMGGGGVERAEVEGDVGGESLAVPLPLLLLIGKMESKSRTRDLTL